MEEKPNKVNTFLGSFYDAAVASGLPEKTAKWYVNWAQKFAISMKGKKPRSRSVKDIGGFLKGLGAQKGIEPWQVDQARKALIFLYRDFFKLNLRVLESTGKTKGKVSEVMGLEGGEPDFLERALLTVNPFNMGEGVNPALDSSLNPQHPLK